MTIIYNVLSDVVWVLARQNCQTLINTIQYIRSRVPKSLGEGGSLSFSTP